MIVKITPAEVNDCLDFALAVRQSQKQFGTHAIRKAQEHIADTLIGKISELALQKFLAQQGLIIAVDFAHYGAEEITDNGQDIAAVQSNGQWQLCTYKVDFKGNAGTAQWLLVERHKFLQNYAQAYVIAKVLNIPRSEDLRQNPEILRGKPCHSEICGFVYRADFQDDTGQFWFPIQRGERLIKKACIPGRNAFPSALGLQNQLRIWDTQRRLDYYPRPMDADLNYGQPISWLRNEPEDWDTLIACVKAELVPAGQRFVTEYRINGQNRVLNITASK